MRILGNKNCNKARRKLGIFFSSPISQDPLLKQQGSFYFKSLNKGSDLPQSTIEDNEIEVGRMTCSLLSTGREPSCGSVTETNPACKQSLDKERERSRALTRISYLTSLQTRINKISVVSS